MRRTVINTLLLIALVVGSSACGGKLIETPTATSTRAPLPTRTLSPVSSTSSVISLSENDEHYRQLQNSGYFLLASGSLIGPEAFTYSAYLFINPDISPLYAGSDPTKDTLVILFYRWNGEKNEFLSAQALPTVDNIYAASANIVNWDQPFSGTPLMDVIVEAEKETKPLLKQENYSSDINQNGLPEFAIAVEYCPVSCTHPTGGVQLFELQSPEKVTNITEGLPGSTYFEMHSKVPFTFYVGDNDYYDLYLLVPSSWIYTWDGSDFVDISPQFAEEYLTEAMTIINALKSQFGKPFDDGGSQTEINSLKILKLYEKAGMSENGLQMFLNITDISHWSNTSNLSQCWLQISRAMAQQNFKQNHKFDIPPSSNLLAQNPSVVEKYERLFNEAGYDTTACTSVKP